MSNRGFADLPRVAAIVLFLFASFVGGPGRAAERSAETPVAGIELTGNLTAPPLAFAAEEIRSAAAGRGLPLAVIVELDPASLGPQCYRIERTPGGAIRVTGGDAVAMAHLGNYYAAKIEAAVALYLFDKTGKPEERTAAVASLEKALNHWRAYAAAAGSQYQPQRLNRIGHVDLNAVTAYVEQDVQLAKAWRPGTLAEGN